MHNQGSFCIDAIYISPGLLQGTMGGYLGFKDGLLSDHHGMWLDLQNNFSINLHSVASLGWFDGCFTPKALPTLLVSS